MRVGDFIKKQRKYRKKITCFSILEKQVIFLMSCYRCVILAE